MKILFFDTETTGLIKRGEKDLEKQPRIVQFAGIVGEVDQDGNWKKIAEYDMFINPGIPIPYEVSQIHHIYDIDVKDKPSMDTEMEKILAIINDVDFVVAHNLKFDEEIIQLEVQRQRLKGMAMDYLPKGRICTMTISTPILRIPHDRGYGFKYPKLQDLFFFNFKKNFKSAHNAMVDVRACGLCFVEMVKNKYITLEQIEKNQIQLF